MHRRIKQHLVCEEHWACEGVLVSENLTQVEITGRRPHATRRPEIRFTSDTATFWAAAEAHL